MPDGAFLVPTGGGGLTVRPADRPRTLRTLRSAPSIVTRMGHGGCRGDPWLHILPRQFVWPALGGAWLKIFVFHNNIYIRCMAGVFCTYNVKLHTYMTTEYYYLPPTGQRLGSICVSSQKKKNYINFDQVYNRRQNMLGSPPRGIPRW